jgi:uncharacterized protein with HEPN domain
MFGSCESELNCYATLRSLQIFGEEAKLLSPYSRSFVRLPWSNIEKIRDLLSHVSRVPMREAMLRLVADAVANAAAASIPVTL